MHQHIDNIELKSEEVQAVLTETPHWMIRFGNLLFLALILLLFFVAWLIKYPDLIPSEVVLTTQVPPQKAYVRTAGTLDALFVENNQEVEAHMPLAVIRNAANARDVFLLKDKLESATMTKDSFHIGLEEVPVLLLGEIESSFALFENSYAAYRLNAAYQPISNEISTREYAVTQLKLRLNELQGQQALNASELVYEESQLKRYQSLFDDGAIALEEFENRQRAYLQAQRSFKNLGISITQIKEALGNAQLASSTSRVDEARREKMLLRSVIQSYQLLLRAISDWEMKYVLKAELDGKVSFLDYWTANQTVNAGDLVFTIVPNDCGRYVAKLKAPARNSGKLRPGLKAIIRLDNYPEMEYGTLNGRVRSISDIPDRDGLYRIDVELPKKLVTSYQKEIAFRQEMRGQAEIITEESRLLYRFFNQLRKRL